MVSMERVFHAASDAELLQEQVSQLSQEKRELENYAERVTRELQRYQQTRPQPQHGPGDEMPLPPWATNMQMMSPLLFAYEERIAELEAVIERSVGLAEQAQALAKQNDALRAELQEKTEQLRNAHLAMPSHEQAPSEEQDELRELYRICTEQNEALSQQNQLLKLQLERMQHSLSVGQQHASEMQARAAEGSRVLTAESEQAAAMAQAEADRAAILNQERAAAEFRLGEVTGELVEEVRLREDLQAQLERVSQDFHLRCQNFDQQKKRLAERNSVAETEEQRLKADLARSLQADKDHRQHIVELERDLAETGNALLASRRDADATRQDAEQMLQVIDSLERRLKDVGDKNAGLQSKLQDQEKQTDQLLLEKDRWLTVEQSMRRQAERLEHKVHSESEMFRQRMHIDVEALESSQRKQVAEVVERLRRSEQAAAETRTQLELAVKQRAWEAAAVERLKANHATEKMRLQSDIEDLQQVRLRAERRADLVKSELSKAQADLAVASRIVR